MCVYVCICICMCVYICMYVSVCMCMYVYMYMYAVKSRYSAAFYPHVTYSRRSMARPLGRDMGRLL